MTSSTKTPAASRNPLGRGVDRVRISLGTPRQELSELLCGTGDFPRVVECVHDKPESWTSLIHLAQVNVNARDLLVSLAQYGYMVFRAPAVGTLLVHHGRLETVWEPLREGRYQITADGVVYSFTDSRHQGPPSSLIVVFSSVAKNRFSQKLDRHFSQVFESLIGSVSGHTAILRVADMDGVVGGFYLPTVRDPEMHHRIQNLIVTVATNFGIPMDRVVTYGTSKGGTGALYHGALLGAHVVSIDPYVTVNRRTTMRTDPYFVSSDIFPRAMDHEFDSVAVPDKVEPVSRVLVTSKRSAEYGDLLALVDRRRDLDLRVVESTDPHINAHHQVASNTMSITLSVMNALAQGLPLNIPHYSVVR